MHPAPGRSPRLAIMVAADSNPTLLTMLGLTLNIGVLLVATACFA